MNYPTVNCECPFVDEFKKDVKCPYKEDNDFCYNLLINTGNGDAWCSSMINRGLESEDISDDQEASAKQMSVNFNWLLTIMNEMHTLICPNEVGTWQQRANQVLKATKETP